MSSKNPPSYRTTASPESPSYAILERNLAGVEDHEVDPAADTKQSSLRRRFFRSNRLWDACGIGLKTLYWICCVGSIVYLAVYLINRGDQIDDLSERVKALEVSKTEAVMGSASKIQERSIATKAVLDGRNDIGYLGQKSFNEYYIWNGILKRQEETEPVDCGAEKQGCTGLGHPEICCLESHTCLPTNNSLPGVFCCSSSDPGSTACNDDGLQCEEGTYSCAAEFNGGCCPYGTTCDKLRCIPGGGPESPDSSSSTSPTPTFVPDLDGDGLTGDQDDAEQIPATVDNNGMVPSTTPWRTREPSRAVYTGEATIASPLAMDVSNGAAVPLGSPSAGSQGAASNSRGSSVSWLVLDTVTLAWWLLF